MIKLHNAPVRLTENGPAIAPNGVKSRGTIAYGILKSHNRSKREGEFSITFDALISHDITYVGIIQTARASGLERFPMPYALTNCHNSLCAVGGTINEDDHVFGLSAAVKYGGIYVPANMAVLHQYARETIAKGGGMVLGSDSHTRYGALGALGVGEGGPELVKQLLGNTWDIKAPEVALVYLTGKPRNGVGPHDVAIALCGTTYKSGFAKNRILEFVGPAVSGLSMDFRLALDVMTTETACLTSIWATDNATRRFFERHGRPQDYKALSPSENAVYDALIEIDLSKIEPMIALPYHPSNAFTIRALKENATDIFREAEKADETGRLRLTDKIHNGKIFADQGVIAGCAGGMYASVSEAAQILSGASIGNGYFSLSVYPSSAPVNAALMRSGALEALINAGAVIKPCFCGPCFGAGDVPSNGALSIRHTTRNFPFREGARPGDGQSAMVALMDARSIAATARNKGELTAATEIDCPPADDSEYEFDITPYQRRVYNGFGRADPSASLRFGPNIADWPKIPPLNEHILLRFASVLKDPVTTTDELIPSGETSSYRSNPIKLASFTLSRRDPDYVKNASSAQNAENARSLGEAPAEWLSALKGANAEKTLFGSIIYANRPGDGSAREQAASCQRVLGGCANLCLAYATKRYRSNLINWGMLPFTCEEDPNVHTGDFLLVMNILSAIKSGSESVRGLIIADSGEREIELSLGSLTEEERDIIVTGCLMNHYAHSKGAI